MAESYGQRPSDCLYSIKACEGDRVRFDMAVMLYAQAQSAWAQHQSLEEMKAKRS